MYITIGDKEIEVPKEARIQDVLSKHFPAEYKEIKEGRKFIEDSTGNISSLEGNFNPRDEYRIKKADEDQ